MTAVVEDATGAVHHLRAEVAELRRELAAVRGELTAMCAGSKMREVDTVPLRAIARELHLTARRLRQMAMRNEFPQLLQVSKQHYLVRRADFEAWKQGRWTIDIVTRAALVKSIALGEKVHNRRRRVRQP